MLSAQQTQLDQFYQSSYQPAELNTTFTSRFDSIYTSYLFRKGIVDDENGTIKEFVLNYNYFLDKLNKSGEIFYNDEISVYLNELKDTLLSDHPEKNNIKVYLTNFTELNAFTNDFGNIYVNVGLIAKMNTVDELLTVLAHEIAHVLLEHSFKQENRKVDLENGRRISEVDEINAFESHKFSQKQELEADSLAFELLKKCRFDLNAFKDAFELLRHSKNPIHDKFPSLESLCFHNSESVFYLQGIIDFVELQDLSFELDSVELAGLADSFPPTHPTINQRIENIELLLDSSQMIKPHQGHKDHQSIRLLASNVYLKKLMDEGNYIEGLYLVNQLRETDSTDNFLIKTQIKLMLLLTQRKYYPRYANHLLNEHGNECNNENYMKFRWTMLHLPPLEMNILTILAIKNAKINDPYMKRLEMLADQFLYKNNRFLFHLKDGKIIVKPNVNIENYLVDDLSQFYSPEERKNQSKNEDLGYQYIHRMVSSDYFVNYFLSTHFNEESFTEHVQQYRSRRDDYNKSLTLDQFVLTIHPKDFKKISPKGDFVESIGYSDSNIVVLAESDTYAINFNHDGSNIDILQTAKYNEMISTVMKEVGRFKNFRTNQVNSKDSLTVKENRYHYLLNRYVEDCWGLSDLNYSSVDEEIQSIILESKFDYVSYNLNLIIRDNTKNKTFSVHYSIYFDLKNMGVVYFSKIPNRNRPSDFILRRIFSPSNQN